MASSIASLFGPSAEEIVYAQQEAGKQRQQQQLQNTLAAYQDPMARQFYQSGYNIASGAGNIAGALFGDAPMADPRLAKSIQSRQIMADIGVEDLNDVDQLATLAQRFSEAGMPEAALYFSDRKNALETQQRDYALELAKAEAKKGLSFENLSSFRSAADSNTKAIKNSLDAAYVARANYELADTERNPKAEVAADRAVVRAIGDAQLSQSEVAELARAAGFSEGVVEGVYRFFGGTTGKEAIDKKKEVINAIEYVLNNRYQAERRGLQSLYVREGGISQDVFDQVVPDKKLSPEAESYRLRLKTKDTGKGGGSWGSGLRPKKPSTPTGGSNRNRIMSGG